MQIKFHKHHLKLKHTFTIAHNSYAIQDTLIVEITDGLISGFGEATANPYYGITLDNMIAALQKVKPLMEQNAWKQPEDIWSTLKEHLSPNSFALCALDMALHDYYGKKVQSPLYKLWNLDITQIPVSNFTIGIDTIENMVSKMQEVAWPIYKIKLGTQDDIAIVRELRKHSQSTFRVDANCAWSVEETIKNAAVFKGLGVEFIEQPLKADDMGGMKVVFEKSALPLVADESCQTEPDVDKCHQHFHGINIKLTKCGGLTPALRMIQRGKELGMKVMVGCMTESSVGISAIAHIAPLLDFVDMDGAMLLAEDIADGVKVHTQGVDFPNRNGTGALLK